MTERIAAARVVLPDAVVGPAVVEVDGSRIVAVDATTGAVPDQTLVPGFVDLQVNGVGAVDVATAAGAAWDELDAALVACGTTTWCPTLITAALDGYAAPLERIASAQARGGARPAIAGAHLEGPFLGALPGAHPVAHVVAPDPAWIDDLPPVVRLVTLGPEARGALAAIRALVVRGVTVALGHSAATWAEATGAVDEGARLVTHCFNAMAPLHHREPGLAGVALADDRVATSLIADLVHVHPAAVRTVFRAKGRGGVALVTDAVAWAAPTSGLSLVDGAPRRPDGTLAGSALTMDAAVRNVVERCGIGLVDAVHAASTAPADVLGLTDRGRIVVGARADLVALDASLHVRAVWVGGEAVR